MSSRPGFRVGLFLVVLASLGVRLHGLGWDGWTHQHPDETPRALAQGRPAPQASPAWLGTAPFLLASGVALLAARRRGPIHRATFGLATALDGFAYVSRYDPPGAVRMDTLNERGGLPVVFDAPGEPYSTSLQTTMRTGSPAVAARSAEFP